MRVPQHRSDRRRHPADPELRRQHLCRAAAVHRHHPDADGASEVYNGDNREHGREIARLIQEELAPIVRGSSIFESERIRERCFALTHSSRDKKTLLEAIACVDYAPVGPHRQGAGPECGGVTEWRRAAALCGLADVHMAHHKEPQIAQHLLAAVPYGTYVECFADPERDPVWQSMWLNRPAIEDGMIEMSSAPGFGLVLDDQMIRRYRLT